MSSGGITSAAADDQGDHVVLEMQPSSSHVAPTASDEEATCRICLDDLSEAGETLLLECSCRGELALAHRECAIEWFSRKGDNTCEVCHHVIQNLPLDLLRISRTTTTTTADQPVEVGANCFIFRMWQEAPGLVTANIFLYFFLLLIFLHIDMGDASIAVSSLLSCILGYLSVVISTRMATGIYIWLYTLLQFACVAISTIIIRWVVKLHIHPMLIIGAATFGGFGVALCGGLTVLGALWLRALWLQQHQQGAHANNDI